MNERKIDWTRPVRTKLDKIPVRIFTVEAEGDKPVVGQLQNHGDIIRTHLNGKINGNDFHHNDLENVPVKRVGWVNIYQDQMGILARGLYPEKADADYVASSPRIACIKIEFEEGEGL